MMYDLLAKRTEHTRPGEKRVMIDLAASYKDVISLGRGDPDLSTPPVIIEAGKKALDEGHTGYTAWAGIPELRQAIAAMYTEEKGVKTTKEEVLVTVGAQESVFLTMMSILNPGDEIILPEPRYTPYDLAVHMAGGTLVSLPTYEEDSFVLRPDKLEEAITDRTKAVLLVTPNNPTASVISADVLEKVAEIAIKNDLLVISDEIYSGLVYDGLKVTSIASYEKMKERTIIINSFSKTYSMTGWRVGYLIAPADVVKMMTAMKAATTICAPAVAQHAALAAMESAENEAEEIRQTYDKRRKFVMEKLDELNIPYIRPEGAFYIFAKIEPYCNGRTSFEFTQDLIKEKQVLIFPGTVFGKSGEGFARISVLAPMEQLEEAFKRIKEFLK